ncbi:MAG TPA: tRNA (adenosine(37)-N6)-threonylcarbamoyltransferase complex dimerization subunit type 1 TsaB [Phycisphaerae bacterium]|nr:tRNA (adenosine(37)-N6)-threonylcarbamoyltransferase complex dimerization subunit type 1 TsaB [Phycisphaerae bacterium]
MQAPRIIAVETSSATGSVALALGPRLLAEQSFSAKTQHARELLPTLAMLHEKCAWQPGEVDECFLSIGPGSFTGLRVAVAFARHLSLAAGARLCAVATLDVIAANMVSVPPPPERLAVILDAKRGQVFGATFTMVGEAYRRDGEARLVEPAVLLHEGSRLSVMGEGIDYHRAAVETSGAAIIERTLWTPRAGGVHRLGWEMSQAGLFTPPHELIPFYLRRPEAEEVWEKRQGNRCA